MKKLTPLKAVRKYCLWCMNDQEIEVKLCPSKDCPLFFLRFGKREKKVNVLKAIKMKCKDCGENAKKCEFPDCILYPYRTGHNPARKGIGGKGNPNWLKGQSVREKIVKQAF